MRCCLPVLLLIACADTGQGLVPIVDVPATDSDAYPYAAIDTLELSIARAGDTEPLALVSADLSQELGLEDVPFGDDLVVHLSGRAAGAEVAYGRTCPVDVFAGGDPVEPHLYFSRLVRWGQGPRLPTSVGRSSLGAEIADTALAVFVGEGVVQVIDAAGLGGDALASQLASPVPLREGASLTPFGGGVLLVGGLLGGQLDDSAQFILPSEENADNQLQALPGPALVDHSATLLEDGSVLITGGRADSGGGTLQVAGGAHIVSSSAGEIRHRVLEATLQTPRAGHSMTRLGNEVGADVLIVGGVDESGAAVASTELYRPLRSAFEAIGSADLIEARVNHAAVRLPGGFVLVVGGQKPGLPFEAVRQLELYDPVLGRFSDAGTLPSSAGTVGMSLTPLPDGRIMLAGGVDLDGAPVSTVFIASFDPIDGVVDLSPTDAMAVPRQEHSAVLLCDGTVLVAGGTEEPNVETERYNPPSVGRR